jgi:homoserine O-succinyltransferase
MKKISVAVLNLMPSKPATERQLVRAFRGGGATVAFTWLTTYSHKSKSADAAGYGLTLKNVKDKKFDVFVITGAPVELLKFEQTAYWDEFKEIVDFARKNARLCLCICWAAQAALYHLYGVRKELLPAKHSGVFIHTAGENAVFFKGLKNFYMPHSRYASLCGADINRCKTLVTEAECGSEINALSSQDKRFLFITGHPEYDADTLHLEYKRDLAKGLKTAKPENYYKGREEIAPARRKWAGACRQIYKNIIRHVRRKGEII